MGFPGIPIPAPWRKDSLQARIDGALRALDGLGGPAAIADHLGTLGIKGIPQGSESCPVARYVKMVAGAPELRFSLSRNRATGWLPGSVTESSYYEPTPPNVAKFIDLFDMGEYPGLCYEPSN